MVPKSAIISLSKLESFTTFKDVTMIARIKENRELAARHGVALTEVAWEDTARSPHSALGPNVSDLSLHVYCGSDNRVDSSAAIVRRPNFTDVTCDLPISRFNVTVGNESLAAPRRISLADYLRDFKRYNTRTEIDGSLYDLERRGEDTHVLASSQTCLLPLSRHDTECEFEVEVRSYDTFYEGTLRNKVLLIVASAEGTSATIVTCSRRVAKRIGFRRGSEAARFVARRLASERERLQKDVSADAPMDARERERNTLLVIQVPLLDRRAVGEKRGCFTSPAFCFGGGGHDANYLKACLDSSQTSFSFGAAPRGADHAQLSAGKSRGTFHGADGKIERDFSHPIRVTFQHYRVTDTHVLTDELVTDIKAQLESTYESADAAGSLVTPTDGCVCARKTVAKKRTYGEFDDATLNALDEDKPLFA